jgi:peptidoglycan/LPS O-acetylase OafA/YrhL
MPPNRIYSLDYLRGVTALAIMFFHLTTWSIQPYMAEDLMGRIGLYGVSVFYILSGLTLFLIYIQSLKPTWRSLLTFGIKRTFRILPLLWLTVGLSILLMKDSPSASEVFLSVTGLFGFIKPAAGIGTGVWSIGNEVVFYTVFPVLILIAQFNRKLFLFVSALLIAGSFYYAFLVFKEKLPLAKQWAIYVSALNQMVLFVGGMIFGFLALKFNRKKPSLFVLLTILLAAILAFIFYPATGDRIALVYGWNRVVFLILAFIICGSVYYLNYRLPAFLHKPLTLTAEISFGLYLLHPVVYHFVIDKFKSEIADLEPTQLVLIIAIISYIFSYLAFRLIEMPVVNIGKFFTEKLKSPATGKKAGPVTFL